MSGKRCRRIDQHSLARLPRSRKEEEEKQQRQQQNSAARDASLGGRSGDLPCGTVGRVAPPECTRSFVRAPSSSSFLQDQHPSAWHQHLAYSFDFLLLTKAMMVTMEATRDAPRRSHYCPASRPT